MLVSTPYTRQDRGMRPLSSEIASSLALPVVKTATFTIGRLTSVNEFETKDTREVIRSIFVRHTKISLSYVSVSAYSAYLYGLLVEEDELTSRCSQKEERSSCVSLAPLVS